MGGNISLGGSILKLAGAGNTVAQGVISGPAAMVPGLQEGLLNNSEWNLTGANPNSSIQLQPRAGEWAYSSYYYNSTYPAGYTLWNNNSDTFVYTGDMFVPAGETSVQFAAGIDDGWSCEFNGSQYNFYPGGGSDEGNGNPDWIWSGNATFNVTPGPSGTWYPVEFRFTSSGASPQGATSQAAQFLYSFNNSGTWVPPIDNGAGNLFGVPSGVIMAGTGSLTLSAANTYSGATLVASGALVANNTNALNPVNGTGVTVDAGGSLQLPAGISLPGPEAISITGTGSAHNGAIESLGGSNAIGMPITVASSSNVNFATASIGANAGTFTVNANVYTTAGSLGLSAITGSIIVNGVVSGPNGVIMEADSALRPPSPRPIPTPARPPSAAAPWWPPTARRWASATPST